MTIDANDLERMAKERPDECFLKGSGILKLTGGIRQREGELRVAVALLAECIGPLEVSAGLIESDDGDEMEYLIGRVRKFVKDAAGVPVGEAVVTKNAAGQIVAVTRQDAEGRILEVIAESAAGVRVDAAAKPVRACKSVSECPDWDHCSAVGECCPPEPHEDTRGVTGPVARRDNPLAMLGYELDGVLADFREDPKAAPDSVCIETIERVRNRLTELAAGVKETPNG